MHIYTLHVDPQKGEGTYTLINKEEVYNRAFRLRDSMLIPAMDLQGPQKFSRVIEVLPGKIRKENNNWKITEMAKIIYT